MPYDQKQAQAIFLNIKRKKGAKAARAFGKKHRQDLSKGAVAKSARYTPDRGRTKNRGVYMPRPDGPLVGPGRKQIT